MEAARRGADEAKTGVGALQAPIPGVLGQAEHGETGGVRPLKV